MLCDRSAGLVAEEVHHFTASRFYLVLQHHVPLTNQIMKVLPQIPLDEQLVHLLVEKDGRGPGDVCLLELDLAFDEHLLDLLRVLAFDVFDRNTTRLV